MTRLGLHSLESAATWRHPTEPTSEDREPAGAPSAEAVAAIQGRPFVRSTEIVELILKDRKRLHEMLQTAPGKVELASRLLSISLVSFALYGVAMAVIFDAAGIWPHLTPLADWVKNPGGRLMTFVPASGQLESWRTGRAERLIAAYSFGLIAASGVCLPSLYFYGLLSGLRMSMTEVVLHALKATAIAGVALIGILPIFAATALGAVVVPVWRELVPSTLLLGLCLPFVAGLWGTASLVAGFGFLCDAMPAEFQRNRSCFLRRLVVSWSACYTAIAPVMIFTVWQHLGG